MARWFWTIKRRSGSFMLSLFNGPMRSLLSLAPPRGRFQLDEKLRSGRQERLEFQITCGSGRWASLPLAMGQRVEAPAASPSL